MEKYKRNGEEEPLLHNSYKRKGFISSSMNVSSISFSFTVQELMLLSS